MGANVCQQAIQHLAFIAPTDQAEAWIAVQHTPLTAP